MDGLAASCSWPAGIIVLGMEFLDRMEYQFLVFWGMSKLSSKRTSFPQHHLTRFSLQHSYFLLLYRKLTDCMPEGLFLLQYNIVLITTTLYYSLKLGARVTVQWVERLPCTWARGFSPWHPVWFLEHHQEWVIPEIRARSKPWLQGVVQKKSIFKKYFWLRSFIVRSETINAV